MAMPQSILLPLLETQLKPIYESCAALQSADPLVPHEFASSVLYISPCPRSSDHRMDTAEAYSLNIAQQLIDSLDLQLRRPAHVGDHRARDGRHVVGIINRTSFMQQRGNTINKLRVIDVLLRLAYHDPRDTGIADIAAWCYRNLLDILHREPENVDVLRAIGNSWLLRVQPLLGRIHDNEEDSPSSGGSRLSTQLALTDGNDEEQDSQNSSIHAERRLDTADYVEARGFLHPATQYLDRAVEVANTNHTATGDLLATAAEAHMSLGNVTSPRFNIESFRKAIHLLRLAAAIPGYALDPHLQQYLDDYGRLVD